MTVGIRQEEKISKFVVVSDTQPDFSRYMNLAISNGWQPIGNLVITNCSVMVFHQAMVKYEEEEK